MLARSTVPSSTNSPSDYRAVETYSQLETVSLILGGIVIITAIASAIYEYFTKQNKLFSNPKLPAKVLCPQCHYFSNNSYIRCVLHPSNVLTDRAVDCRDYS